MDEERVDNLWETIVDTGLSHCHDVSVVPVLASEDSAAVSSGLVCSPVRSSEDYVPFCCASHTHDVDGDSRMDRKLTLESHLNLPPSAAPPDDSSAKAQNELEVYTSGLTSHGLNSFDDDGSKESAQVSVHDSSSCGRRSVDVHDGYVDLSRCAPVVGHEHGEPRHRDAVAAHAGSCADSRFPTCVEDLLWNLHLVLIVYGPMLPIESLADAYLQLFGHELAVERFLVVNDDGLAATLKRIPHVVTISQAGGVGPLALSASLPLGTTREGFLAADQDYRVRLSLKHAAAENTGPTHSSGVKAARWSRKRD